MVDISRSGSALKEASENKRPPWLGYLIGAVAFGLAPAILRFVLQTNDEDLREFAFRSFLFRAVYVVAIVIPTAWWMYRTGCMRVWQYILAGGFLFVLLDLIDRMPLLVAWFRGEAPSLWPNLVDTDSPYNISIIPWHALEGAVFGLLFGAYVRMIMRRTLS